MLVSPIRSMMHKASPIHFSASQGHYPNYQGDDEDEYVEDTYTESYPPQPQGNFTFSLSPAIPPHLRNTQTPSPHFMTHSPYYKSGENYVKLHTFYNAVLKQIGYEDIRARISSLRLRALSDKK